MKQTKVLSSLLKEKILLLPDKPGSYQIKNNKGVIIYVGKAKNLKNRVSQYFKNLQEGKVQRMVEEAFDFDIIETESEQEALLLEISLIHKYKPKYNIQLMDDKSYPYIALYKDKDPYFKIVRKNKERNCLYFGPYPDSSKAYKMLNLLNKLFPLRKCSNIKDKPCLYFYLGQCLAPCMKPIEKEEYDNIISNAISFLNGDSKKILQEQKNLMKEYSKNLEFEKANDCKEIIDMINKITEKQKIIFQDKIDRDVIGYSARDGFICIYFMSYKKGTFFDKFYTITDIEENIESTLEKVIISRYENSKELPKEVLISLSDVVNVLNGYKNIKFYKPSRGNKFDLLSMSLKNANQMLDTHFQTARLSDDILSLLKELKEKLLLENDPLDIELYDNSHLQGYDPVSVMVKYINGVKSPKQYRKFNLTNCNTKDDLLSMKEVLTRRFSKAIKENEKLPDLILMDGGEEQCKVALDVIKDLNLDVKIAGLKKNDKHQTSTLVNAQTGEEIELDRKSPLFFLLTRMQDEVHRFAIGFHNSKQEKSLFKTIYDDVEGIGFKRKQKLLEAYPTIESFKNASKEELLQIIPIDVIEKLYKKIEEKQ